jgi:hypothetical protein
LNNPLIYIDPTGQKSWLGKFTSWVKKGWDEVWDAGNQFARWADQNGLHSGNIGITSSSTGDFAFQGMLNEQQLDWNGKLARINRGVLSANNSVATQLANIDRPTYNYRPLNRARIPMVGCGPLQCNGILGDNMNYGRANSTNYFSRILDFSSNSVAIYSGLKYTSSNVFRTGYWRGVNGKFYSLSLVQKGQHGWVFYRGSANIAMNSVKWAGGIALGLGYLSAGYSGYQFVKEPSFQSGSETLVGIGSIFFWEVGAVYYGGKSFYELTQMNTEYLMKHGINPGMQFIINKE